ncbi:hypothetical protein [Pseudogemmobacter humi]|nr:hypothetical protein [Pseudogemmobacter humi]
MKTGTKWLAAAEVATLALTLWLLRDRPDGDGLPAPDPRRQRKGANGRIGAVDIDTAARSGVWLREVFVAEKQVLARMDTTGAGGQPGRDRGADPPRRDRHRHRRTHRRVARGRESRRRGQCRIAAGPA